MIGFRKDGPDGVLSCINGTHCGISTVIGTFHFIVIGHMAGSVGLGYRYRFGCPASIRAVGPVRNGYRSSSVCLGHTHRILHRQFDFLRQLHARVIVVHRVIGRVAHREPVRAHIRVHIRIRRLPGEGAVGVRAGQPGIPDALAVGDARRRRPHDGRGLLLRGGDGAYLPIAVVIALGSECGGELLVLVGGQHLHPNTVGRVRGQAGEYAVLIGFGVPLRCVVRAQADSEGYAVFQVLFEIVPDGHLIRADSGRHRRRGRGPRGDGDGCGFAVGGTGWDCFRDDPLRFHIMALVVRPVLVDVADGDLLRFPGGCFYRVYLQHIICQHVGGSRRVQGFVLVVDRQLRRSVEETHICTRKPDVPVVPQIKSTGKLVV